MRHHLKSLKRLAVGLPAVAGLTLAMGAMNAGPAVAADTLTVIGHSVHQRVTTKGEGGNVVADWEKASGATVEWLTFGVTPIHDRLFREAELSKGAFDAAFILNRFVNPDIANLFEPLDDYQAKDPIPEFDGISAGMREALTFDGKLYAIPFRHATHGLHYNEALLAERGLDGPPKTFEEFIEYAEKLTYKQADGTQVHGFVLGGQGPANVLDVVRALGGDFITPDFKVVANEAGMVEGIGLLAKWYQAGVMPKAYINFTTEDVITFMQQGRVAMAINPFGRTRPFNDPKQSKYAGQIKVTAIPSSDKIRDQYDVVPAKTEFWALSIPKNSQNKEQAWDFIKHVSTLDSAVRAAINGNGPVRSAAYDDSRVQDRVPYYAAEAAVVKVARVPLPGFKGSAKVDDIFKEEVQAALLGTKTPQKAMDDLTRRTEALLPK